MTLTRQNKFFIALAFQLLVIFAIMLFKVSVLKGGDDILLTIRPVDPRDILRGDFVTFQYDINEINSSDFNYSPLRNGDTVYVPLRREEKFWRASCCVIKVKPVKGRTVYLKGRIASGGDQAGGNTDSFRKPSARMIRVVYGIEDYFIPEGSGSAPGQRFDNAYARVTVDESGRAVLKKIYIDGEPWP